MVQDFMQYMRVRASPELWAMSDVEIKKDVYRFLMLHTSIKPTNGVLP